ncbi:hypothetical protein CMQ_1539 [Grosmannia clavigera kw1407]|uniref:F-box domain containing protein n=1 Tax=Grosmannia clavigera (strain kw1407 / UAMH 11150) TaxID=655863 RepID=F0XDD7_GROCL|nr:uncharacterized protein CMQ_1539 [Grosmannia clavigera kw1407]EFX04611.1 hypothetical protein CMQ_1539 [Grosmannia clavigera kw1407]
MDPLPSGKTTLADLPLELWFLTCSFLPNRDIKSLRLVDRAAWSRTALRLSRVFLSASPQDIDVFRKIADHECFRRGITEIIWDDAPLPNGLEEERRDDTATYAIREDSYPGWFFRSCEYNKRCLREHYKQNRRQAEELIAAMLPVTESWAYFRRWREKQLRVISTGSDAAAFAYGLRRFKSLRRIQVTAVVHGRTIGFPLYETPAIRALPRGFNYPLPRGWIENEESGDHSINAGFDSAPYANPWPWRGVRICLSQLAKAVACRQEGDKTPCRITDLSLQDDIYDVGINSRMFEEELCPTYDSLVTSLRRLDLRHFHLSLAVDDQRHRDWQAFRSRRLQSALAAIGPMLESLTLGTNLLANMASIDLAHHVPLKTIFPPGVAKCWPRLDTLRLYGFWVTKTDVIALLASLPRTVRRIILGELEFVDAEDNWRGLLYAMRDTLGWRERPAAERPSVAIFKLTDNNGSRRLGQSTWADASTNEFLYGDGICPYGDLDDPLPNKMTAKVVTETRDAVDLANSGTTWTS